MLCLVWEIGKEKKQRGEKGNKFISIVRMDWGEGKENREIHFPP